MTFLIMVAAMMGGQTAHAYELHTTEDGHVVRWRQSEIVLELSHEARDLDDATELAASSWRGLDGVPEIAVIRGRDLGPPGYDGRNGVYIQDAPDRRHGHLAVTVLTVNAATGEILDADVLVDPEMLRELEMLDETDARHDRFDSASLLAHELGHVIGLDDTSEPHRDATMWGRLLRGSTTNRTLDPDDRAGALAAYGLASTPDDPDQNTDDLAAAMGCTIAPTPTATRTAAPLAAALALALTLTLRRRRLIRTP